MLETGGGIKRLFTSFWDEPFICVNADVYTDFDFEALKRGLDRNSLGKLVLVENPAHNPRGTSVLILKVNCFLRALLVL